MPKEQGGNQPAESSWLLFSAYCMRNHCWRPRTERGEGRQGVRSAGRRPGPRGCGTGLVSQLRGV